MLNNKKACNLNTNNAKAQRSRLPALGVAEYSAIRRVCYSSSLSRALMAENPARVSRASPIGVSIESSSILSYSSHCLGGHRRASACVGLNKLAADPPPEVARRLPKYSK